MNESMQAAQNIAIVNKDLSRDNLLPSDWPSPAHVICQQLALQCVNTHAFMHGERISASSAATSRTC
jgi:hypothetical protein